MVKEDLYSDNSPPVNLAIPVIMLMIILIFSASMYYRSTIVGLSYAYFPLQTEKHFPKILQLFEKVKIPFNAELNKIEISNFGDGAVVAHYMQERYSPHPFSTGPDQISFFRIFGKFSKCWFLGVFFNEIGVKTIKIEILVSKYYYTSYFQPKR